MERKIDIRGVRELKTEDRQSTAKLFDNQLMTIKDLSKFLKVPEPTIRDWKYKKKIPFLKLGRSLRFSFPDISKWLNERSHYADSGD